MNDKTEQTMADALRLAAKSAAPYGTAMIGASHLNEAADTIDTLRAQLAEAQAALKTVMRNAVLSKEPCCPDPESPAAIRNGKFADLASIAAQGLGMVRGPSLTEHLVEAQMDATAPEATHTAGNWISAADVDRLTHELDVAMNGKSGAAPQASLCDVVAQAKAEAKKLGRPLLEAAQTPTLPPELVAVPLRFLRGFSTLAHNYSLCAEPPDHYRGTEGDAFSDAYRRCGRQLARLAEILTAAPKPPECAAKGESNA